MTTFTHYVIETADGAEYDQELPCGSWSHVEEAITFLRPELLTGEIVELRISGVRPDGHLHPLMHVHHGRRGSLCILSAQEEWARRHSWHYRAWSRLGMTFRLIRYRARRRLGLLREEF